MARIDYLYTRMRQKKKRFDENKTNSLILEREKPEFAAAMASKLFSKHQRIVLEVGAGRGEYTIALAEQNPETQFVGIDIKGDRLWYGAKEAKEKQLKNVLFLRAQIEQIEKFFRPHSIAEIWITFPGPRPKESQENRRVTNQRFLNIYKNLLKPDGLVKIKTDSELVFEYTLEELAKRKDVKLTEVISDIDAQEVDAVLKVQTHFEQKFRSAGKTIKFLAFRFLTKQGFLSTIRALFRSKK